jgi:hypothetical protein
MNSHSYPNSLPPNARTFLHTVRDACRKVAMPLLTGLMLSACGQREGTPPVASTPFSTEVVVRTAENFHTPADVTSFVAMAARNQVAAISVLVKQDEDGVIPSGQVFFNSKIAPIAPGYQGFDVLQTMIDAAHPLGIKVRAWVPQFHDQTAVLLHPEWQMMVLQNGQVVPYTGAKGTEIFANPLDPGVQHYELAILKEIATNYAVDGITLDWLRFDNYNMDLGTATRQMYQAATGIDPLTIDFTLPGQGRDRWNNFRTDGVAAYAHSVRGNIPATVPLGVFIMPPDFVEVAQDAAKFNTQVSFLEPMCYFRDWNYTVDWVWNNCMATTAQKAGVGAIFPTMDSNLTDDQYRQILAHLRQDYRQVSMISWFYHGQWTEVMLKRIALIRAW